MKRIILTGASSGIGLETAKLLARPGHELVLVSRHQQSLLELMEQCLEAGARAHAVACDVTNPNDCEALVADTRRLGGTMEPVLVNVAGFAEFGDFATMPFSSIESQIATNLVGPLRLCHAMVPWMLEAGCGQIVNVLSIAATHTFPGSAGYSASKAGLLMAGRSLAAEVRRHGIRVTAILPGATDTPLWGDGGPERADMLPATAVAEAIAGVIDLPADRCVDELVLMPPKGIL